MEQQELKNSWGGPWTEAKLETFEKYVRAYLTIMKRHKYWKTIYFDGFAGSGSRQNTNPDFLRQLQITEEEERVYEGAAQRVLDLSSVLHFDYYYFYDKNPAAVNELQKRLESQNLPHKGRAVYRSGDANEGLGELANALQDKAKKFASLVLLDPFGMQINWASIEQLKGTRADIWILVPTGVIINRLLDKKGELKHSEKLKSFFGLEEEEIRNFFYSTKTENTLFGEIDQVQKITRPIQKISELYIQQLKNIWKHVSEKPLILKNSKGTPIFHFIFASNNETALKIANQIVQTT